MLCRKWRQTLRFLKGKIRDNQTGDTSGGSFRKKAFCSSIQQWIAVSEQNNRHGELSTQSTQHLQHFCRGCVLFKSSVSSSLNHWSVRQRVAVGDAKLHHISPVILKTEQNISRDLELWITCHHKRHQCQALLTGGLHKDLCNA